MHVAVLVNLYACWTVAENRTRRGHQCHPQDAGLFKRGRGHDLTTCSRSTLPSKPSPHNRAVAAVRSTSVSPAKTREHKGSELPTVKRACVSPQQSVSAGARGTSRCGKAGSGEWRCCTPHTKRTGSSGNCIMAGSSECHKTTICKQTPLLPLPLPPLLLPLLHNSVLHHTQ
jgi:hypothetical protein